MMRRQVAAYEYAWHETPPGNLREIGVIKVAENVPVPVNVVHWDVAYYTAGDPVPANLALYAAYPFSLADLVPAVLRRITTWVVGALGPLFGHGHLNFSHDVDSHHVATVGL